MVKGIYTANEGMKAILRKQEVISNNLANANTTGFKKSDLFIRAYVDQVSNDLRQPFINDELTIDDLVTDFSPGPMIQTGNPLDLAVQGKAFFTVMLDDETVAYSRSGAFTIDNEGMLSTLDGKRVIGETDKPIPIDGSHINILDDGQVQVDGRIVNKLKLSQFQEPNYLIKLGANLYQRSELTVDATSENYKIQAGYLEGSNVNPIETMVKMISSFRNYEADQKAMQAEDQTLSKAVNEIGIVR
ncbi:MAG: flagellar basal-body rod protein FlgF [Candidatus Raymondbacteria bacterium RifOxyA12_full_50_37]|uniref:Flagellar basal-body rod protein FlgF n=1 Tax=Candidatus Raymondbacteria bacterium RIFOXYD12_FULL_49_13 TaxID=1817890 RepID=A0A1F7F3R6_UNCRA|nr:MAG: flagellar basal-body rod protein FlgF [Candidatus Raymondbacteria bacterium RIFOXYA2_FULL_49_16]OGJ91099.1 MAG: flagellar basal-body rod protein FlgF [Candidatus Raymondbacteria bacterium RifOxyB12_full_50_8]OGJ91368.1 MAG: flagellar basal-body rod protein FlgF [Candidatus Raymondbacteria bacterium RifOxyA12_full_50_37]OGJ97153.1 MAG: flagellar basal-body rod protein FlgF [Candidatus Raymondbacteria bacterium RIFOXYC2_FULL_50_21]OGK01146.1 MAG: flagellar basal-body rod protein FlgF [Can